MLPLDGRLALVTGGARGIGAAIARALAENGAQVVVGDILEKEGLDTVEKLRSDGFDAWFEMLDVADRSQIGVVAQRIGDIRGDLSILINNAGIGGEARLGDPDSDATWDRIIAINLNAVYDVTSAFLPALKKTRGCIVNLSSVCAFTSGFAHAAYTASKGGVTALTQAMCRELAPFGIRVNAVAPGYIDTSMGGKEAGVPDNWVTWHCPMSRLGDPREVGGPVVFLASPSASFVSGATLPIDGGYLTI